MPSLTIFIPAYREATTLRGTYETVINAARRAGVSDYEIIIVTDNAPDRTHDVALGVARDDNLVRVLYRPRNTSLGYKYREALAAAAKEYFTFVPAHNLTEGDSLVNIFGNLGRTESVISYVGNPEVRPPIARIISKCFVLLCNILFGFRIKYYNGTGIQRTGLLRRIPMSADNSACMAEIVIYLAASNIPYIEIPQFVKKTARKGRAFNFRSAASCFVTIASVFWKVRIKGDRIMT